MRLPEDLNRRLLRRNRSRSLKSVHCILKPRKYLVHLGRGRANDIRPTEFLRKTEDLSQRLKEFKCQIPNLRRDLYAYFLKTGCRMNYCTSKLGRCKSINARNQITC